jgi:hypothetical protein
LLPKYHRRETEGGVGQKHSLPGHSPRSPCGRDIYLTSLHEDLPIGILTGRYGQIGSFGKVAILL